MAKSKSIKIIRSSGRQAKRDVVQVAKTAKAASKVIKSLAKIFVKPPAAKEKAQIERLLGEEYSSLRAARKALKEQSTPGRPVPGYARPSGVLLKRPAAAPGGPRQGPPAPGKAPGPIQARPGPKRAPGAARPAPPAGAPIVKPPGRPGRSVFSTRSLGLTQDDVERGLMELAQEDLARKMDARLLPGEQWAFIIRNPETGFFFRSKLLFESWSKMVRYLRGKYQDLGPNAMQAITLIKVSPEKAPQRQLSDEEYKALVKQHKTAAAEQREAYFKAQAEELKYAQQELAKRGIYPVPTKRVQALMAFRKVFEREEKLKAAEREQKAAAAKAKKNERARARRAEAKAAQEKARRKRAEAKAAKQAAEIARLKQQLAQARRKSQPAKKASTKKGGKRK